MKSLLLLIACLLLVVSASAVNAPVLFFSDLISGPASGNSDTTYSATGGVYVTLYGNFLTSPTVTLNGASCLTTVSAPATWMWYQRMIVKLGTTCTTGNFVITTSGGTSNGLAFTVRSGNVLYVKSTGNDSTGTGSFSAPWLTLLKARDTIAAGDVVYDIDVSQTADDGNGFGTCMLMGAGGHLDGTAANPKAMVAYPGASVTIGNATPSICPTGIRTRGDSTHSALYWTFAEFNLRGRDSAVDTFNEVGWRLVGNDFTCPNTDTGAQAGCLDPAGDTTGDSRAHRFFGNNIHNAATNNAPGAQTGLYHGVYVSEKQHDIDFGWNTVAFVNGGRCIQVNVNVGPGSYDLHIHDNVIHDCAEDGIVMTTTDPSKGTVEIYNNVIYTAGTTSPGAPVGGGGAWNCINVQGWSQTGVTGEAGTYQVYNNTMYACGTNPSPNSTQSSGAFAWQRGNTTTKNVNYNNNIIYQTTGPGSGFPYFLCNASPDCGDISGTKNLFFGNGTPPTQVTSSVNSDPGFVNAVGANFHLSAVGSSANGAGTTSAPIPTYDYDGLTRPSPPAIGAFEFSSGSLPPASAPAPSKVMFALRITENK